MKGRWGVAVISVNLLILVGLVFAYPHLMVSPGPLVAAHSELTNNCASCHTPWRGPDPARCVQCHVLADIGLRTTDGARIVRVQHTTAFHQQLVQQDCNACHSDHQGPLQTDANRARFTHALLRPEIGQQCVTCHSAPINRVHENALGNCAQCHNQKAWKPATLDHDRFFVLDRNHSATCVTCHTGSDYRQYTCYGCHAHSEARIRAKHQEEGIRNFQDCARCHRSGSGEGEGEGEGGGEGGRRGGREGRD
jgi:hypothetical protein